MAAVTDGPRTRGGGVLLQQPNARVRRSFTAAAEVLDAGDKAQAGRLKRLAQDWQTHSWSYYKSLGLIHFAHDYLANCASRSRLYPGFIGKPGDPPTPLDDMEDPEFTLPEGADKSSAQATVDAAVYLDSSYDGGLGALMGDFGLNVALAGEGFLHGCESDETETGELFQVRSVIELRATSEGYKLYSPGTLGQTGGELIPPDEYVMRLWRKDRQWIDLADAPMRALLDDCDNLLALKRVLLASTYSRMHGGILKVPSGLLFPQLSGDPSQQAQDDPVMDAINRTVTQAIQDPASVNAVAPVQISGPKEELAALQLLDIGRGYGAEIQKQIADVERTVCIGLDLPPEIIMGLGGSNHWNAFAIDEQTFKAHIEPLVLVICRGLTKGYLWPKLRALGVEDLGRYCFWYDPSALIGHPDRFANAQVLHQRFVISDDALARAADFSEDDAPDDEEVARRIAIAQQLRVTIRAAEVAPPGEIEQPSQINQPESATATPLPEVGVGKALPKAAPAPAQPAAKSPTPSQPGPPAQGRPPAKTAAAVPRLGDRLAAIDRDLLTRLHVLADTALRQSLEQAGRQLYKQAGREDRKLGASLRNVPLEELGRKLGRDQVQAWGLGEHDLIDEKMAGFEHDYRRLTAKALAAALIAGRQSDGNPDALPDHEIEDTVASAGPSISAGWALLAGAIVALAHDRLFNEPPGAPPRGEIDTSATVPIGTIRDSLAVAGGGQSAALPTTPSGGVALGPLALGILKQELQVFPQGWQWVWGFYGEPDRPFEPHNALDGQEFSSWDDDVLANNESWPDTDYFRPGDHNGCCCGYIPMFASDRGEEAAGE
jgi:hypothetical protein